MRDNKLIVAQYGCGYWGPNLVRNFSGLPDCEVQYVVDPSPERRAFVESSLIKQFVERTRDIVDTIDKQVAEAQNIQRLAEIQQNRF